MSQHASSRYRLLLVNPRRRYRYHWDLQELCEVMGKGTAVLPLALPTLAALTPDHYEITLCDEQVTSVPFDGEFDLVGITALGPNVKRAYEIADRFRQRGVPVVMGGPQVSFNVEETLTHADTVVVGEAEGIWPECLRDFEQGRMRSTYRREAPHDFTTSPRPRWDLADTDGVMALGVQASRGCPYACAFCLVRNLFGRRQRYRDLDDLIAEIAALPKRQITFVDDNLTADKRYARELMRRLQPLGVSWMCQSSLDLCEDEELIAAMARAGCTAILLGIESLNPQALQETGKLQNRVSRYERGIETIHRHGIHVIGSFIVGFDVDHLDAFDQILEFTDRNHLAYIMLNVLTVYPGTDLYAQMEAEGRCTPLDPDLLHGIFPTMQYENISQEAMFGKYFETLEKMFETKRVHQKALATFGSGNFRRYNAPDVRARDKLYSLFHLTRKYVFTSDRDRRRLFRSLVGLALRGTASMGAVVEFLLLISSFQGYLRFTKEHREEILNRIRAQDPGPRGSEGPRSSDVAGAETPDSAAARR